MQMWSGVIDFQIQGSMLFGDVTFTRTTTDRAGNVVEKIDGRTFQECKRGA
jgi:hypothetical protein